MTEFHDSIVEIQPKIIGGNDADISKFTFQVLIQVHYNGYYSYCGGSLISPNWILTAAHCFYNKPKDNVKVIAGHTMFFDGGVTRQADKVIINDDYKHDLKIVADMALIHVSHPFKTTDKIRPVLLFDKQIALGTYAYVSGWGAYSPYSNDQSNRLQFLYEKTISLDECKQIYPELELSENNVCAGNGYKGTCGGDSGGPLAVNGNLIGVLSTGPRPCGNGNPDIYMNVSSYRSWIRDNTGI
ncbi:kallikrein-2-like [Oppia nitens]|uniref:kallikrein-2-like n=1 Tax=Oppia nitens TaxID=1686743 RepID=UPI0023DC8F7B|nr:kallikrein-2-like [Oppia nitens]